MAAQQLESSVTTSTEFFESGHSEDTSSNIETIQVDESNQVIINIGGQTFETNESTLKKRMNIFDILEKCYRTKQQDYFLDRDPQAFGPILNYLRFKELHIPTNLCCEALQNELKFWGIHETAIARCCWGQYYAWKKQAKCLNELRERHQTLPAINTSCSAPCSSSRFRRLQAIVRAASNIEHGPSWHTKVYTFFSFLINLAFIVSFGLATHPSCKLTPDDWSDASSFIDWINGNSTNCPQVRNSSNVNWNVNPGREWEHKELALNPFKIFDILCLVFFLFELIVCLCPLKPLRQSICQNLGQIAFFSFLFVEVVLDPVYTFNLSQNGLPNRPLFNFFLLLRLLRVFRLIRYFPGLRILFYTLRTSWRELMLMLIFILIGMVFFAVLIFIAESEKFPNIPVGIWWSVVTMTTVGYGDLYPETGLGYLIGCSCAVIGLLMVAFTVPISVSNFILYYNHVQYEIVRREKLRKVESGENRSPSGYWRRLFQHIKELRNPTYTKDTNV